MNKADKSRIKAAVLGVLQRYGKPMTLPVPIKAIIKSNPRIRVIPYSRHMKTCGLSYTKMLAYTDSKDACADYYVEANRYVVYYNDIDDEIVSSNRYRWNLAHELGHIALNHHKTYEQSRLFRNSLSDALYQKLEDEADMFAAYILVPHIVLHFIECSNDEDIKNICKISGTAVGYRKNDFDVWQGKNRLVDYDYRVLTYFADYILERTKSKSKSAWLERHECCPVCLCHRSANQHNYCSICGNPTIRNYGRRKQMMIYQGLNVKETGVLQKCPVCENEQTEFGSYCIICGTDLVNKCASDDIGRTEECGKPLPTNARYCPLCGGATTFLKGEYLMPFNYQPSDLPF